MRIDVPDDVTYEQAYDIYPRINAYWWQTHWLLTVLHDGDVKQLTLDEIPEQNLWSETDHEFLLDYIQDIEERKAKCLEVIEMRKMEDLL